MGPGVWILYEEAYTMVFLAEVNAIKAGIQMGAIKIETSIFYQTVWQQLKHLTTIRSIPSSSGIAINPWLNITEFNWYECQIIRQLKTTKLPISWQKWKLRVHLQDLKWIWHLSGSCQEGCQGLINRDWGPQ
jgi:hypothetical protein